MDLQSLINQKEDNDSLDEEEEENEDDKESQEEMAKKYDIVFLYRDFRPGFRKEKT